MATGYKVQGVDFDDIFEPLGPNTQAPATGYKVQGVDLNQRFAAVADGDPAQETGHKVQGVDLGNIFAAIGSVQSWITPWGGAWIDATALSLNNLFAEATARARFTTGGEYIADRVSTNNGGETLSTPPVYFLPAGLSPSQVEVRATLISGDAIANNIAAWSPLTANRSISLTVSEDNGSGTGNATALVQVEAREIANTSNATTGVVTLRAEATSEQ